jgi:adenylate cyclase
MNRHHAFQFLGEAIATDLDDSSTILQKSTLLLVSILTTIAGLIWATMYYLLGFEQSALIPLLYSVVIGVAIVACCATKHYRLFLNIQLVLIFALPFALHWQLGGVLASGVVMVWGFLAPLGAALFQSARQASRWMILYIVTFILLITMDAPIREHAVQITGDTMLGFFTMNILGTFAIVFVACRFFISQYEMEYERSENLLTNILPLSVAKRLKRGESNIVDGFQSVTILFADLVGFTRACAEAEPKSVLTILNEIFSAFDELVEKYDLEKIKTIGDAYMVVGGLPVKRDFHAQDMARMALEMQEVMNEFNKSSSFPLKIRIGIHTGSAIAGVIGVKKFAYDVWGDAVNTASRMESHGLPEHIQVSETTYLQLRDKFDFEDRGLIEVKGKDRMNLYLLMREKNRQEMSRIAG